MSDSTDANLQLKKRARRRLVGAIAFAGLAAVVLPMIMDDEPKQQIQDVQIRIPGQDQAPPPPKLAKPATPSVAHEKPAQVEKAEPVAPTVAAAQPAAAPAARASEANVEKSAGKATTQPADKASKPASTETRRAAAILEGKASAGVAPAAASASTDGQQYVILIGAFSNPANVKQLQTKIGELGVKVYTEPLESPEGRKTRVRAGPFPSREAADKALDKMKRIGVNGIVAAKQ